ncbi:MAG: phage portal protein [Dehalococcoidia bacterium]|nr:phage portal protein [Dehalococcoidia bacterium]
MSIANLIATTGPIAGLSDDEKAAFSELWSVWTSKLRRNMLRKQYYEQRNVLKDLGIAIPPHLTDLELVLGWPAKAVDVLARRCRVDGFVSPGMSGDDDPFGVQDAWLRNDLHIEMPQTIRSALKYSCAFLSVTRGMASLGEPEVMITSHSALYAAATWDAARRRLATALTVTDMDSAGRATGWVMFLPGVTIRAVFDNGWMIDRFEHTLDRLPVEVIPFAPDLDRPFGCSRISRAVMGLSDSALRTLFRMEIHAEFFSSPQRYAMGADESMFQDADGNPISQWQAIIGRVWAAGRDPDTGDVPQLGQFAATSPQPHTDQLRTLSAAFCAESSIPLSELGIVHDANPTSAEAIEAAERPLVQIARDTHDNFGPRIARAMVTAVQIRDGLDEPSPELLRLTTQWRDPEEIPQSSSGDFLIKLIQALPWLAESRIPLEQLGWSADTIERAFADRRRANVTGLLQRIQQPELNGDLGS